MKKVMIILTLLVLLAAGCASPTSTLEKPETEQDKLVVYTTIFPIYDFTKKIGGELVEPVQIMPAGADPHHFEPSARMLAELSQAQVLIYNGAGMENWMDKTKTLLEENEVLVVDTSSAVNVLSLEENDEVLHHEDSAHDANGHQHNVDPHLWLSPKNAKLQGQAILEALVKADPANSAYYNDNFVKFVEQLELLDADFSAVLNKTSRKEIVVAHEALGYLVRDYGLVQIPLRGLTAEAEPSPAKLREIVEFSKSHKITHIFFETMVDPKVSQIIAEEIGVHTLEFNTLGNLTPEQLAAGEDYFSIMRKNLANLEKALTDI